MSMLNAPIKGATVGLVVLLLQAGAVVAQESSCDRRRSPDPTELTSPVARSDAEIASALKRAAAENAFTRAEIIIQGVFGPCYSATARSNHFELDWMRLAHEPNDRSKDVAAALEGVKRVVALFRQHKTPIEARPINVSYSRFKASDVAIMYTVHWPARTIIRAIASPEKADEILRNGYAIADGDDPPREWFQSTKSR